MSQVGEKESQEQKVQEEQKDVPVSSRAWLAEIQAALKREKKWREDAKRAIDRYIGKSSKWDDDNGGNFNILWSNTELLRNAIYSQTPKPDVRQRWEQKDPLSLAVAQVLQRSLQYIIDVGNFDNTCKRSILDYLLPGRSVMRVRYKPEIIQQAGPDGVYYDMVASENVVFETTSYKDFVCHDAFDWTRCEWVAFRHYITKAEAKQTFPEYAEDLSYVGDTQEYEEGEHGSHEDRKSDEHTDIDAKALVWEVWDRRSKSVVWVTKNIPVALLRQEPPLDLSNFFPIARPLIGVMRPDSLLPATIFSQYEEQADELDILTERIRRTSELIKWRGFYDSSLGAELETFFDSAGDGELVPTSAATLIMERGGFQNMLWTFPLDEAAKVLSTLYDAREKVKDTIYEITGISDILRGVSGQYETASAQKIKAAWGGSRVDGYKREIQRFVVDTLRIAAEIIAENYDTNTLAEITGLKYPQAEEKQQWEMEQQQIQMQMEQLQAQGNQIKQQIQSQLQPGQEMPPPPPQVEQMEQQIQQLDQRLQELGKMLEMPSWAEIDQVLKSDLTRSYKVSIETDSTIAPNEQKNLEDIQATMNAIGMFGQQFMPAVEKGVCPPEMFAQILYAVVKKTPLSSDLAEYFDEYLSQAGAENPYKKEIDDLKKQLEEAQSDRDLREKELDIKAREAMQKGKLESRKLDIEAAKNSSATEIDRQKLQQDAQAQIMDQAQQIMQNAAQQAQQAVQAQEAQYGA